MTAIALLSDLLHIAQVLLIGYGLFVLQARQTSRPDAIAHTQKFVLFSIALTVASLIGGSS
jgi:hypothetical protein